MGTVVGRTTRTDGTPHASIAGQDDGPIRSPVRCTTIAILVLLFIVRRAVTPLSFGDADWRIIGRESSTCGTASQTHHPEEEEAHQRSSQSTICSVCSHGGGRFTVTVLDLFRLIKYISVYPEIDVIRTVVELFE